MVKQARYFSPVATLLLARCISLCCDNGGSAKSIRSTDHEYCLLEREIYAASHFCSFDLSPIIQECHFAALSSSWERSDFHPRGRFVVYRTILQP